MFFMSKFKSVLALSSVINAALYSPGRHKSFWVERLANEYANNKFGNRYGATWGTSYYPLWSWKIKDWWYKP